jgi:hypothetical protein
VETIGTGVVAVLRDEPLTLFVIDHYGTRVWRLLGGPAGLWKTDGISSEGFQRMVLTDHKLIGEARQPTRSGSMRAAVKGKPLLCCGFSLWQPATVQQQTRMRTVRVQLLSAQS